MGPTVSKLKRRLSAADISETPRSRRLAVAITVKPGAAWAGRVRPCRPVRARRCAGRTGSTPARPAPPGRQRVISSTRATAPLRIAVRTGEGTSACRAGPLGEQQGVVPAVAELVLGGAGGALHGERAGAADGGGQQLGQHRLGGARLADEQQAALAGEGDHAALDQGAFADELPPDDEAARHALAGVGARRAARMAVPPLPIDEGDDGARGEPPAGRARPVVVRGEERQLVGVPLLGRLDLPRRGRRRALDGVGRGAHRRRSRGCVVPALRGRDGIGGGRAHRAAPSQPRAQAPRARRGRDGFGGGGRRRCATGRRMSGTAGATRAPWSPLAVAQPDGAGRASPR